MKGYKNTSEPSSNEEVKEAADEDKGSSDEHTPVGEPEQLSSLRDIPNRVTAITGVTVAVAAKTRLMQ